MVNIPGKKNGSKILVGKPDMPTSQHVPPVNTETTSAPKDRSAAAMLWGVTWLASQSPAHKHLFIADLEWLILPPVQLKQFRLWENEGRPVAFISWAYIGEEVEGRLKEGTNKLRPNDWKSGDSVVIMDIIAPFGGAKNMLAQLKEQVFPKQDIFTLIPNTDGKGITKAKLEIQNITSQ